MNASVIWNLFCQGGTRTVGVQIRLYVSVMNVGFK